MNTHQLRRPTAEDAALIHDLVSACDLAVLGRVDTPIEDVADELVEPEFDLDSDGWIAEDAGGRAVGWAWACRKADSDNVDVEVLVRPGTEGLSAGLWALVLGRAKEIATELGHAAATVDIGIYRDDEAKRAEAAGYGFEPGTSFHRMRIDFAGPVTAPDPLPGVTLRTGEDEAVRRQAHHIHQEGFADHFGFVKNDYDAWHARRQAQSGNDWSQVIVASVDGEPAAMIQSTNAFVPDEDCGYVGTLSTLPAHRGRGLGRHLLLESFARDAARGRKGTILHVDSNNTTPALGLYTSAGMRPIMVIDVWRRRI
ncbi:GNAT family N-acetyltransferase [Nonomuraea typhae]|uniref:GNAT family N-acetyltransferase n=1 Tax=Nonomuraea typhae TaxID=2603600 RepID=UPI0012F83896|nr:GNAT family N-acetyltransferase [Nonomuraea typhae]